MTKTVRIIVGSNRPNRNGHKVAEWVKNTAAEVAGDMEFSIVDLLEIDLPFLDEPAPPAQGDYQNSHTKEWAKLVDSSDAIIFVSPEYNGGYSAVLKNALDTVYAEWTDKPVAIVGYGAGPGLKAAAQLREVLEHMKMQPIEAQVNIRAPWEAFGEDGSLNEEYKTGDLATIIQALKSRL